MSEKKISDAQQAAQKRYDEKTKSITIKYTPADMKDFERMMEYLNKTGKSRSSFIKELINGFFSQEKDMGIPRENGQGEYFKYEYIEDESLVRMKSLIGNDEKKYNTVLDFYDNCIESDMDEVLMKNASSFMEWIEEVLEDEINNGTIDLTNDNKFYETIGKSIAINM